MAAPNDKNIHNLNGKWTMNKKESDPFDPILSLQGIGWVVRKAIGLMTVQLIIKEYKGDDGSLHIDIKQPGAAGISGTEEKRHVPNGPDKEWRDHEDHIFGHVKGYTQWIKLSDLSDADENEKFLKQGWIEPAEFLESYVESQGKGWTARQIWGFAIVESDGKPVHRYVRRVVVKKGTEVKRARLIYDFLEELKE